MTRFQPSRSALALVIVAIPLTFTSANIVTSNMIKSRVNEASADWLEGTDFRVVSVQTASDGEVDLVVIGQGEPPPIPDLEAALAGRLFSRTLRLEVLPTSEYVLDTR